MNQFLKTFLILTQYCEICICSATKVFSLRIRCMAPNQIIFWIWEVYLILIPEIKTCWILKHFYLIVEIAVLHYQGVWDFFNFDYDILKMITIFGRGGSAPQAKKFSSLVQTIYILQQNFICGAKFNDMWYSIMSLHQWKHQCRCLLTAGMNKMNHMILTLLFCFSLSHRWHSIKKPSDWKTIKAF